MSNEQNEANDQDLSSKTCEELLNIGELISLKEAAKRSGFSNSYLHDIAGSRLCAKQIDTFWLTTMAAVEAYKQNRNHKLKK